MTKTNLILAGIIAAGLLIGVAVKGYKDAAPVAAGS